MAALVLVFKKAFGRLVKIINDTAMQTLNSTKENTRSLLVWAPTWVRRRLLTAFSNPWNWLPEMPQGR